MLGGGQLGRMFALAAHRLGYRVHVFDPEPASPAAQVAECEVNAPYDDMQTLGEFAAAVDVVTFEFENIPVEALRFLAGHRPVRPSPDVLHVCQNRRREKEFLTRHGFPCARHAVVASAAEAAAAAAAMGFPCVMKTAEFGYDGKGQARLESATDAAEAWDRLGAARAVIEEWVDYRAELSVVCARAVSGAVECFPVVENVHVRHILDRSIVPARVDPGVAREAQRIATSLARTLDVTGLLSVEFFLRRDGSLLVNEMAPRPHNSGHFTLDACVTSQFEQHVRAVCGLPPGSGRLLSPAVMVNILGDAWKDGEPRWEELLGDPGVCLHLYGKRHPRPGRKMGHFTVLHPEAEEVLRAADSAAARLFRRADAAATA